MTVSLSEDVLKSFRVAKVFRDNTDAINGMDFSPNGDVFVTSSVDESLTVYDVEKPAVKATVNSKKYGVENVTFTRNNNLVIHGSTKVDHTVRLLSLKDNKYLRYFPGHTDSVVALGSHPQEDQFLSASLDGTLRLWDCNASSAWASINFGAGSRPVAAYDPEGLIVALGVNSEEIRLLDIRKISTPFNVLKPKVANPVMWSSLAFSPNGHQILLSTFGNACHLVDAFMGNVVHTFTGYKNAAGGKPVALQASFTPDSQFVLVGSTDSRLHVYNVNNGTAVCTLKCDHTAPIRYVKFNPRYSMMASTCTMSCFWISTPITTSQSSMSSGRRH